MSRATVATDGIFGLEQVHPIYGDVVHPPYELQYVSVKFFIPDFLIFFNILTL